MRHYRFLLFTLLFANILFGQEYNVYYGNLHAHTCYSDGSGTPEEAYQMAKDAGLDFFGVTPHNHTSAEGLAKERKDGILIAWDNDLYNGTAPITFTRKYKKKGETQITEETITGAKSVISAANSSTNPNFLALYGQEFSTISSSNHINVFNYDSVIKVKNGDIKGLIDLIDRSTKKDKIFFQLNHPDYKSDLLICDYDTPRTKKCKNCFNDYGIDNDDFGPYFSTWVQHLDPYTHLIEVLSGPAMKKAPIANYRYDKTEEDSYYFYLKQGLHVSPSVGQDNHYKTWGKMNDARVGVLATELTNDGVLAAVKANRTFASEDKNLSVILMLNGKIMGENINLDTDTPLNFKVRIKDEDEPNASYEVDLIHGNIEAEDSRHVNYVDVDNSINEQFSQDGNGEVNISGYLATGNPEFYFIRCKQAGDDRIWTAPVWINHPKPSLNSEMFYWTKSSSSEIYHVEGCKTINSIKPENLRSGTIPPSGRRQHDCKVLDEMHTD